MTPKDTNIPAIQSPLEEEQLFSHIKQMLDASRKHIAQTINSTMVETYWQIGKYIVEYEQKGKERAEYGKGVIPSLSKRLMAEYGGGFTQTNLKVMRQFYLSYPKSHALRDQLSWTHWRDFCSAIYDILTDQRRIKAVTLWR